MPIASEGILFFTPKRIELSCAQIIAYHLI